MAAAVPTWGDRLTLLPRHLAHLCSHLSSTPTRTHTHTHTLTLSSTCTLSLITRSFPLGRQPKWQCSTWSPHKSCCCLQLLQLQLEPARATTFSHVQARESERVRERTIYVWSAGAIHSSCTRSLWVRLLLLCYCEDGAKPAWLRRSCIVPRRR